jgi:hypothetical protein
MVDRCFADQEPHFWMTRFKINSNSVLTELF